MSCYFLSISITENKALSQRRLKLTEVIFNYAYIIDGILSLWCVQEENSKSKKKSSVNMVRKKSK